MTTKALRSLFPAFHSDVKTMVFVDGENLAIRYGDELKNKSASAISEVAYDPNVYVWSGRFYNPLHLQAKTIRTHYYTSVQGDQMRIDKVIDDLRKVNIEHPSVFQRKSNTRSKQVDISLCTDMLLHATRKNYETAVLVAGDEDYVPLVKAVKSEGRRVILWFISNGLSPVLQRNVDLFFNIEDYLFEPNVVAA
jgi:hypothetical protein